MVSIYSVNVETTSVAHQPIWTVGIPTDFWHFLVYLRNYGMSVHDQLGLKRGLSETTKQ